MTSISVFYIRLPVALFFIFFGIAEGRRKKEEGRRKNLMLSELSAFHLS
ncbi:MAG: hypothetical protein F6K48_06675 [Okeania sp. SIO3H1]|nr:hypothetical protein [Okeania sp. SIO3H1]